MLKGQIPVEEYLTGNTKNSWNLNKIKSKHKIICEYTYNKKEIDKGFNNLTLYINLTKNIIREKKVSNEMKKLFTGGRGFGLKLLWDSIKPNTRWDSDNNELIITTGPLCGSTQYPGSGKSL